MVSSSKKLLMGIKLRFQITGLTSTHGNSQDTILSLMYVTPFLMLVARAYILQIQFYGNVRKFQNEQGKNVVTWEGGEIVKAVAYDVPIPGFDTPATNNLRLWSSKAASGEFDFQKFNSGDYESSVADQQRAETISAVLYPNDNLERGKELRLKQQYFWVAASLYDIVRRFKKSKRAWREFPEQVAIQLNDTHPTLAVVELQRILIDLEGLEWDEAWSIVTQTVSNIHLRLT